MTSSISALGSKGLVWAYAVNANGGLIANANGGLIAVDYGNHRSTSFLRRAGSRQRLDPGLEAPKKWPQNRW